MNLDHVCWEWSGARDRYGYGKLRRDTVYWKAHRLAWTLEHGPIPDGMYVCHHCDNPPCVNPAHLFLGTSRDNQLDRVAKGRHNQTAKTHCPRGHPYDEANTRHHNGRRFCRACKRERQRAA
jgi:HNH endonuclease